MGPLNGRGQRGLVSEINVTPLVDVMLVLLIIFMVTAPMMTQGLDVDLPETTSKSLRQDDDTPLVVTIDKDAKITLGKLEVNQDILHQQLNGMAEEKKKEPIYLKADKNVSYGVVVSIMEKIKTAGFNKLGMITQPADNVK